MRPDGKLPAGSWPVGPAHPAEPVPARLPLSSAPLTLHAALLAATAFTLTFAGSLWELTAEVDGLAGLFRLYLDRPGLLLPGVPFAASLLAILGAHEMGHYLACRYYRIPATLPFFIPGPPPFGTFGAVIRIRGIVPHRRALFDVAAAGPIAGWIVALPVLLWGLWTAQPADPAATAGSLTLGRPPVVDLLRRLMGLHETALVVGTPYVAGWFGMLITSMNLFPVGQLDGGHVTYSLSRRTHRAMTWITLALLLALVVASPFFEGGLSLYTLWFLILLWMRDRHPPVLDEGPGLGPGRLACTLLLLLIFVGSFIAVPLSFPR